MKVLKESIKANITQLSSRGDKQKTAPHKFWLVLFH